MTAEPGTGEGGPTVGSLLRRAREERGLSQESLAEELKLPLRLLRAIEADEWGAVPPGRQRPLARQLAARLRMDLEHHPDALGLLPGGPGDTAPDPGLERLERGAMAAVGLGSIALLAWLLIPGPSLRSRAQPSWMDKAPPRAVPPPPPRADGPYPVLGELLPEAPVTAEGLLITLRAQDACDAEVVGADGFVWPGPSRSRIPGSCGRRGHSPSPSPTGASCRWRWRGAPWPRARASASPGAADSIRMESGSARRLLRSRRSPGPRSPPRSSRRWRRPPRTFLPLSRLSPRRNDLAPDRRSLPRQPAA